MRSTPRPWRVAIRLAVPVPLLLHCHPPAPAHAAHVTLSEPFHPRGPAAGLRCDSPTLPYPTPPTPSTLWSRCRSTMWTQLPPPPAAPSLLTITRLSTAGCRPPRQLAPSPPRPAPMRATWWRLSTLRPTPRAAPGPAWGEHGWRVGACMCACCLGCWPEGQCAVTPPVADWVPARQPPSFCSQVPSCPQLLWARSSAAFFLPPHLSVFPALSPSLPPYPPPPPLPPPLGRPAVTTTMMMLPAPQPFGRSLWLHPSSHPATTSLSFIHIAAPQTRPSA